MNMRRRDGITQRKSSGTKEEGTRDGRGGGVRQVEKARRDWRRERKSHEVNNNKDGEYSIATMRAVKGKGGMDQMDTQRWESRQPNERQ